MTQPLKRQQIIGLFGNIAGTKLLNWLDPCCNAFCDSVNECGGGSLLVFDNGLVLTGNNAQLGGTLVQDTILDTGGFLLKLLDGNQGVGKVLTSDADGNISWQISPGAAYTFDNGLTETASNVQLGGLVLGDTTVYRQLDSDTRSSIEFNVSVSGTDIDGTGLVTVNNNTGNAAAIISGVDTVSGEFKLFGAAINGDVEATFGLGIDSSLLGYNDSTNISLLEQNTLLTSLKRTDGTYTGEFNINDSEAALVYYQTPTSARSGVRSVASNLYQVDGSILDLKCNDIIWTWPGVEGSTGDVLTTNGSGLMTWESLGTASYTSIPAYANNAAAFAAIGANKLYYTDVAGEYIVKLSHV